MSDSYHVNRSSFKNITKKELEEMANDETSLLNQWAKKKEVKDAVRKQRKQKSENKNDFQS